jgi:cell division septum initiation protein DivIVA
MRYSPVELRHVKPARTFFGGYKRDEIDKLMDDIIVSFEEVWRERGEFADKLEDLEKKLEEVSKRESLLAATLVAAEKTAAEAIEGAKREAEVILAEAHQESRSITRAAQGERQRLFAEVRRIETLLRAALGMVEETGAASDDRPATESWPNRQDTREFEAISPPPPAPTALPPVQEHVTEGSAGDDPPAEARDFAWG